jgi:hypothetical protein
MSDTGIVVLAQNNAVDNYVEQACLLAMSVHVSNPSIPISVITNDRVPAEFQNLFDNIIPIPFGDGAKRSEWKIENRWKIYHASPYEKTIVMDTDALVLQNITGWLTFLDHYDLYFTNKVYTYRQELVTSTAYRKTFVENNLANLYSGFHYFKRSDFVHEFYAWLEIIMKNWKEFYKSYLTENCPEQCSVDVSAAIAAKIMDCENEITNNLIDIPRFTHMKPFAQNWKSPETSWQKCVGTYINDNCDIKIGNHAQAGILHYTENSFIKENAVFDTYRRRLNV